MAIETLLCNNFCAEEVALKVRRTGVFAARKAANGQLLRRSHLKKAGLVLSRL